MVELLEKIYEFTSGDKNYGAYIIKADSTYVVIQHENKFYGIAHFNNSPIKDCIMPTTQEVIDVIKKGI